MIPCGERISGKGFKKHGAKSHKYCAAGSMFHASKSIMFCFYRYSLKFSGFREVMTELKMMNQKWKLKSLVFFICLLMSTALIIAMYEWDSPLLLDSVFTIFCGMILGPVWGTLCGLLPGSLLAAAERVSVSYFSFSIINGFLGFISGLYFNNKREKDAFYLVRFVFILATLIAGLHAFLIANLFPTGVHSTVDYLIVSLKIIGIGDHMACFIACFIFNFIDKTISVFLAYICFNALKGKIPVS